MTTASIFRPATIGPLTVFLSLYYASILLELVEHWDHAAPTYIFLALAVLCLGIVNRATILLFVGGSTVYFLAFRFPDVANHVNLILFVNVFILIAVGHSLARREPTDADALYHRLAPVLRLSIIATFFVAGFHKLNADFLDTGVSCIRVFSGNIREMLGASVLETGIPAAIWIGAALAGAAAILARERRGDFVRPRIDWRAVLTPLVAILAVASVLIALRGAEELADPRNAFVFFVAVFVLCWQLVEGPLLLIKRFQWVALILSLAVHAQLALIRIVDFQSVAVALLAAFVPWHMWKVWSRDAMVAVAGLRLHRAQIYLLANIVIGGGLMWVRTIGGVEMERHYVVTGLIFNLAVLTMIWPFLSGLFSRSRDWRWGGTDVIPQGTSPAWIAAPLAIVLFGMTSHLGLRTAGNFSMFSNLRTEGDIGNHLILQDNQLQIWDYQDDLVEVLRIDDDHAAIGHHYAPLEGRSIPAVEFRKLLYLWREDGRAVPATVRYRGEEQRFDNIATAPEWRVDARNWEMRLMDFRVVQPEMPNTCRW